MGKTKQNETTKNGVLNLIPYDENLIDNRYKEPNCLLDDCVGIVVDDNGNWELIKVKQVTVTNDNIKTTTKKYNDKYQLGNVFQEWATMEKFPDSYVSAAQTYAKMLFLNEVSKLKYCKDINKLIQIQEDIRKRLEDFAKENVLPQIIKDIGKSMEELSSLKRETKELIKLKESVIEECNDLIKVISEKRIEMIAKGILDQKKTVHRNVDED